MITQLNVRNIRHVWLNKLHSILNWVGVARTCGTASYDWPVDFHRNVKALQNDKWLAAEIAVCTKCSRRQHHLQITTKPIDELSCSWYGVVVNFFAFFKLLNDIKRQLLTIRIAFPSVDFAVHVGYGRKIKLKIRWFVGRQELTKWCGTNHISFRNDPTTWGQSFFFCRFTAIGNWWSRWWIATVLISKFQRKTHFCGILSSLELPAHATW